MTPETINDLWQAFTDRRREFIKTHGTAGRCALSVATAFKILDTLERAAAKELSPAEAALLTSQIADTLALVSTVNLPREFPQVVEQACEVFKHLNDAANNVEGVAAKAAAALKQAAESSKTP